MSWNNEVINEEWTWTMSGDTCISITIIFNGYMRDSLKTTTKKTEQIEGFSSLKTITDYKNSTVLYTDTYTYNIPEAKQWDRSVHTDEEGKKRAYAHLTIEEESDYINKRNGIRRQLEVHNG